MIVLACWYFLKEISFNYLTFIDSQWYSINLGGKSRRRSNHMEHLPSGLLSQLLWTSVVRKPLLTAKGKGGNPTLDWDQGMLPCVFQHRRREVFGILRVCLDHLLNYFCVPGCCQMFDTHHLLESLPPSFPFHTRRNWTSVQLNNLLQITQW